MSEASVSGETQVLTLEQAKANFDKAQSELFNPKVDLSNVEQTRQNTYDALKAGKIYMEAERRDGKGVGLSEALKPNLKETPVPEQAIGDFEKAISVFEQGNRENIPTYVKIVNTLATDATERENAEHASKMNGIPKDSRPFAKRVADRLFGNDGSSTTPQSLRDEEYRHHTQEGIITEVRKEIATAKFALGNIEGASARTYK